MYISKIKINNFRSIGEVEIELNKFNVFVGQNNHGKSNFLEAIEWFYNGSGTIDEIKRKGSNANELSVEIEFSNIQLGIEKMHNEKNKATIKKEFKELDTIKIKRSVKNDGTVERLIFYPDRDGGIYDKSGTGFDKSLNDFLPKLEFVQTETSLKDKAKYGTKTEIGQMLGSVVNEVLSSGDDDYKNFVEKFNELFVGDNSKVAKELAQVGIRVEKHLKKQFAECELVQFQVKSPKFDDLLKNFDTHVDDGFKTTASEKGDGMQRALMLAIIQTYADYRRENENIKNFIFLIDEAELHLHPKAQRSLKNALLELSTDGDQIIITSHSSVLIADDNLNQNVFQVEKTEKVTNIKLTNHAGKQNLIYELLGGQPSDLLFPDNFLLVEGSSDKLFLDGILARFYPDKPKIQIAPVWGDVEKTENVYDYLASIFAPLGNSLYQRKVIILLDKISTERKGAFSEFLKKYPILGGSQSNQIYELECGSIEEYYPIGHENQIGGHNQATKWKRTQEEVKLMKCKVKHTLAKHVSDLITKEQFEDEMPTIYNALNKCWSNSFTANHNN